MRRFRKMWARAPPVVPPPAMFQQLRRSSRRPRGGRRLLHQSQCSRIPRSTRLTGLLSRPHFSAQRYCDASFAERSVRLSSRAGCATIARHSWDACLCTRCTIERNRSSGHSVIAGERAVIRARAFRRCRRSPPALQRTFSISRRLHLSPPHHRFPTSQECFPFPGSPACNRSPEFRACHHLRRPILPRFQMWFRRQRCRVRRHSFLVQKRLQQLRCRPSTSALSSFIPTWCQRLPFLRAHSIRNSSGVTFPSCRSR